MFVMLFERPETCSTGVTIVCYFQCISVNAIASEVVFQWPG